jgi:OmcA/MtrC family decaheme c-type cytochrome
MEQRMKRSTMCWGALALVMAALSGCGGGGGGGGGSQPAPTTSVGQAISAAAAVAANDTATNSSSAFKVLQDAGVPAVTVKSPPTVNFTVFSDGAVKTGLTNANVRFAIAKLIPGTNGDIDKWTSYVYRTESTATAPNNVGSGPNGTPALASAKQATTDPNTPAQLVYNSDGYYTYTFSTDIKDPAKTNGVTFEPNRTHRIAIQLSYTNAAGETVLVNPYFDVTFDANGNSVAVTDPSKTRVMADVASCNSCHEKLALHGGGRVDVQYCVMCHNPGTTDANSGNVLTMQTMVHKIHAGKLLASKAGGETYTIWGFGSSKHDYSEVGFPQDLRNCTKCHSGANPKTPQGDNWKSRAAKESCLTCHANNAGSDWDTSHAVFANALIGPGAAAKQITNAQCAGCHRPGSNLAPETVHWNQNEENAAKYRMNIESATYDAATRKVTVKYFLSDPTSKDAAYNLVTPDCTYTGTAGICVPPTGTTNNTKFGNLRFYLAYQNLVGQLTGITEFTAYNNGGSSANAYAHMGTNDGANHYTVQITVPADTATAVAAGTARVVSIGQIKEPKLEVKSLEPRPQVVPTVLINTVVQHTYKELALTGVLNPRRQIVSNEKCNACHGALGTTSGSNTLAEAFHSGARNTVEACVVCHDANRMSSTKMTNGLDLNESYQFKRMIHGIHGNSKRFYPFTHGNTVVGAFCNPANTSAAAVAACNPNLKLAATVENYAAEVAYPGVGLNCNACHVNNSYKFDQGPIGAVISKPTGVTDPLLWNVISPKAASCTGCHDSSAAIGHVTSFGFASFGNRTQAQSLQTQEICADCHGSGGFKSVDIVHGQK